MRLFTRSLSLLVLAVLSGCQPVNPRIPSPLGPPQAGSSTTMQGIVSSVERPRPEDSQAFVHIVITPADAQPVRLALAPGWYLEEQGIRFEPQQTVQVSGKQVLENGHPSLVVQSLRRGDQLYILRDERQHPVWLKR